MNLFYDRNTRKNLLIATSKLIDKKFQDSYGALIILEPSTQNNSIF